MSAHENLSVTKHSNSFISNKVKNVVPRSYEKPNEYYRNWNEFLKDIGLIGRTWRAYRVNALYDFEYGEKMLEYSDQLRSIVKDKIKTISNSQEKSQEYDVCIDAPLPGCFDKNDPPPVRIRIKGEDEENDNFYGLLLSVGRQKGFLEEERNSARAIILPLFLVNCTDEIYISCVQQFLEKQFACFMRRMEFSQRDLIWMVALFFPKNGSKEDLLPTLIEYKLPSTDISTISYRIDPELMIRAWEIIVPDNETDEITEKQAYKFFAHLEYHLFKNLNHLNLSKFPLHLIKTSLARVTASGFVQFFDTHWLYFVVKHLTQVAHEIKEL